MPTRPMVMAVAAPIIEGEVAAQANMPWPVRQAEMRQLFPQVESHLLNDFVSACPCGADRLKAIYTIFAPTSGRRRARQRVGLGNGPRHRFRAALWCPGAAGKHQPSSPAKGHATWAPVTDSEWAIAGLLRKEFAHLDVERVLSGPGLMNLYRAICTLNQQAAQCTTPAEVTAQAVQHLATPDSAARAALDHFCGILGVIGDPVLILAANVLTGWRHSVTNR